jgi:transposase
VFHLVGLNLRGEVVVRKKFSRPQLLRFTANRQIQLIGMEACGGSHFLGRALREQGHEVRLIPAQYVKPYVKTNKSDYIDAEAIAEAVGRPTMRFVPIKTDDQLDLQSLHRVRERWVMRRTAVVNQIRGLLQERGITLRKGRCHLDAALPGILEDGTSKLSGAVRLLLAQLKLELDQLAIRLEEADALVQKTAQQSEVCRRLDAIPGIGPLTATALVAAIGNGAAFRKGREFAAWVGLVPREHSTGGKQKLLGISKRGNSYLRRLFVQGARAVLQFREKQSPGLSAWWAQLTARTRAGDGTDSSSSTADHLIFCVPKQLVALPPYLSIKNPLTANSALAPSRLRLREWRSLAPSETVQGLRVRQLGAHRVRLRSDQGWRLPCVRRHRG